MNIKQYISDILSTFKKHEPHIDSMTMRYYVSDERSYDTELSVDIKTNEKHLYLRYLGIFTCIDKMDTAIPPSPLLFLSCQLV